MVESYSRFRKMPAILVFILFFLLFAGNRDLFASHAMGGDIYYECINPATNSYRITFVFYRDCAGIGAPSSVTISGTSSCGSTSATAYRIGAGVDVSPLCPGQLSRCSGGPNPGVERYIYQATISNLTPCTNWTFYTGINARNGAITTGPSGTLHIQTTLNSVAAPCNSSPQFATIPVPYVCINNAVNYSQGATDPDGDSLAYALVHPRTGLNTFVNFNFPYSPTYPLSTASGTFGFNPVTGGLSFTPNLIQVGVLAIEVREYRNGVLIGTTIRDIQITVLNCSNQSPNTNGIFNVAGGDTLDNFTARVCPNSNISFNINSTDPDGNTITLTSNVGSQIPTATFTSNSPNTNLSASFSWTPTNNDRGLHTFIIEFVDNGCPISARSSHAITIIVDSVMEAGPDTAILCNQAVQLLAIGGDSFTWSPAIGLSNPNIANPIASNTVPTMYTVQSNCGSDSVFVDVQGPSHTVDAGNNDSTCPGAPIVLNGSVTPPNGNYTISWDNAGTLSNPSVLNPTANPPSTTLYTLTVSEGPCIVTDSVEITTVAANFNLPAQINHVSCNGGNDGSISLTASGGVAPYTYQLNGGAVQNNGLFNNLSAGSYNILVTDALQCDSLYSFTITEPTALQLSVDNVDSVQCYSGSDGLVTVSASGGTPGYQFNVNGGPQQTSGTFNNLSAANYTVRVTDTNGCFLNQVVPVYEPAQLSISVDLVDSTECAGGNDGRVRFTTTGGVTPYQYQINGGASQASNNFPGLTAGSYTGLVTDANGCMDSIITDVFEPIALSLILNTDSVNCHGGNDGQIFSFPSGGIAPYRYSIDGVNYVSSSGFPNLSFGTYTIYIRDYYQCEISDSVQVYEPTPVNLQIDSTWNVSCFGFADGGTQVIATGGTGTYSYSLDGILFQGSNVFTGLAQGPYQVIMNDHYQCADTVSFSVTEPTPLAISVDAVDSADCNQSTDGSITVSASGATPGYQFSIDNQPFVASGQFNNLGAGTYMMIARDSNQCVDTAMVDVYEPSPLTAVYTSVDSVSCNGYANGSLTGLASGGTGNIVYSLNGGSSFQQSGTFNGLSAGPVTLIAQDHNLCQVSIDTVIPEPTAIVATLAIDSVNCHSGNDGSIIVNASGGTAPLSYSISNVFSSSSTFNNLSASQYTVSIRDQNGCLLQITDDVLEPAPVQISLASYNNISCFQGNDGTITVSGTGGTGNYGFRINGGPWFGSPTFSNLTQGSYTIAMTDQYGCLDSLSQSLTQPTALTFSIGRLDSISCHNTDDGEVQVIAGGGTPPYRYSIDGINYQSGATFSNLTPGSYTVTLRDTNDCQETVQFTLFNPLAISPTISGLDMVSCNGFTDGFIQVAPLNGFPPFTYSLDGISYQGGGSFSNLGANTYTIRIKDRKGCEESINIVVTEPTPLDLNLSATDVTCYGFNDGTIIATANGGTPPYIYRLNAGPWISNNNYIGLGPNSAHQVVVEDDNGCQTVKTITIIEPAPLVGTAQTTDVTCWGGQDGTITISAAGGISPYIYEYSPDGVNWYNNFDGFFDNLAGGDYDLRIRDDNRCIYDFDAVITEPLRTIVNFDFDSVSCYGYSDGMIHLSALSPNDPDKAPFTFSITGDNFSLNPDIGGLAAGTHTVYSRDQDGCIDSVQFYMPQPPQQVVTLSPNPMTLELGNSMQVGLMLNGRPDMNQVTYQWVPGYFISCTDCPEPYINTPFSGNYKVRVIENNYGCKAEATIEVIVLEPDPIFVPNIFTPNGDGWNDFVYVFGNDLEQIEFQIYDRWGEKVFETVDQSFGWDGTFKGVDARPGVYTWVLDGLYINGQRIQEAGTVTLYR